MRKPQPNIAETKAGAIEQLPRGVSVVIPVYNSAESLPGLVDRLQPVLKDLEIPCEVVLVNDGSRDCSWTVVQGLAARHSWVRGICLMRNYGQHCALLCGVRAARYDRIITMDDDLQHPPEEIPLLLAKLEEGYDVVYGTPEAMQHSVVRNFLSRFTKRVLGMAMGVSRVIEINAFRSFRTRVRSGFRDFRGPTPMLDVMLSWGTNRFGSITVRHARRQFGRSNYSVRKLVNQALLLITGFTTGPLRVASWVGFLFTLLGGAVLSYVVAFYILQGSVPGFPFLASIVCIFSGAQLFALGIIGEYVARIFSRTLERPTYVVGEVVAGKESETAERTPNEQFNTIT